MNSMISVRGVSKHYETARGLVRSLENVSLEVEQGEFITLVGPSGCGKSTMLNLMAGLLEPTSGEVLVDGKVVTGPGPDRGVIFQQYALFPWLTALQNVEFGLRLQHMKKTERRELAQHYLDLVGLGEFAHALPKELSGGMKQRCAIARAYAVQPSTLLMDEPFGALDALTRVNMQENLLETWQQERRTAVFITHDVDEAVFLATRVVVMSPRPGRISEIIDVPLAYPRTEEMRLSPEFAELRARVWRGVHHHAEEDAA
ncbi:NitT/TauT family transport system ATP-binding protein [Agromyces terreus]|uniref:NitT/TauT family transport system ATP-binding protein n=1 Tax=Agromyces terreus TaxID=424795 RepID=A0A9X2GYC8_9MICO|nr:ABC transporter ATP-binding protein [Agromyces terreus]MCP2369661.1 NitT/TauT family transport system ATP-binding protein [Agromyces terreus]